MPNFRPSGRATLIASALAATLVVGATSGAVGAKLITSKDIKDGTIVSRDIAPQGVGSSNLAKNSVNWDKQLDAVTRSKIAALAGVKGAKGDAGTPGVDGDGSLVAWDFYGLSGWSATEPSESSPPLTELRGLRADRIHLDAGVYQVNVRGLFNAEGGGGESEDFPLLYVGDPFANEDALQQLSGDCQLTLTAVMGGTPPTCMGSLTVYLEEEGDLPIEVLGDFGSCTREEMEGPEPCMSPPYYAEISVFHVGGDLPDRSGLPGCDCTPALSELSGRALSPAQREELLGMLSR